MHINKGRLHAFRKLSPCPLPTDDCHAILRSHLLASANLPEEYVCISIAWDWMYRGVTEAGIKRELSAMLRCSVLNKDRKLKSLAIPEVSLLHMARSISLVTEESHSPCSGPYRADPKVISRGILPSLRLVVEAHKHARVLALAAAEESPDSLTIVPQTDADMDPQLALINAYGSEDYSCRVCSTELSNVYCHCERCKKLLKKDYNICVECFVAKQHLNNFDMGDHPHHHSLYHHTGGFKKGTRCVCVKSSSCLICDECAQCRCQCHTNFTVHTRFFDDQAVQRLLSRVELLGTLPHGGNYYDMLVAGTATRQCTLFPLCLKDASVCKGTKRSSCSTILVGECPSKEAVEAAKEAYMNTNDGIQLKTAQKKRKARLAMQRRRERVNDDLVE